MVNAHGALVTLTDLVTPRQKALDAKRGQWGTFGVPCGLCEEGPDWTSAGCLGIYTAHTELLAYCVCTSRLETKRLEQHRQFQGGFKNIRHVDWPTEQAFWTRASDY